MLYLWLKAFHVISVVAWMAALFYLPRLFVYHADAGVGSPVSEQFKIMERRLSKAIMLPAAVASWFFGVLTGWSGGFFEDMPAWLAIKLGLVVILTAVHVWLAGQVSAFQSDKRPFSNRTYRIVNEVPTLLLIGIVVLVIVKPFD